MKTILQCSVLLVLMLTVQLTGVAQSFKLYSNAGQAIARWDSLGFAARIQGFTVSNDAPAGNDTLFIAINNDTTAARIVPLLHGEVIRFAGLQARFVRTRSSGAGIIRRIVAY